GGRRGSREDRHRTARDHAGRDGGRDPGMGSEIAGFHSVGIIDRLISPNYEPLVTLAVVAGATSRILVFTSILIAPLRPNALEIAKQASSLDALSNGRLTLGVGSRDDDYELSGMPARGRGRSSTTSSSGCAACGPVTGGPEAAVGPPPVQPNGPELLVAGHVPGSFARVARFADGW